MRCQRWWCVLALGVSWAGAAPGWGADWADVVQGYSAGATYAPPSSSDQNFSPPLNQVNQSYTTSIAGQTAGAIVPELQGITGDTGGGVMTPFNPAYDPSQMVGIGEGGSITLQFASPVATNGFTIGVHTGAGLIDFDWPNGSAYPPGDPSTPASLFTTPRQATVAVSADNVHWVTLGTFEFDNPSNYYASGVSTPGYQDSVTGGTLADVNQPFLGTVDSFDGQDWSGVLGVLNGSAGGTWLDLSGSGLPAVNYVQFSVPTGSVLYLDGVVGLPVPEPASAALLALGVIGLVGRRRRRSSD